VRSKGLKVLICSSAILKGGGGGGKFGFWVCWVVLF